MRRWLLLLSFVSLGLGGCYHDESSDYGSGGECGVWGGCQVGVSFELTPLLERLDRQGPVTLRACFDQSCDELELSGPAGSRVCSGAPGGPPDQLTGCAFRRNQVSVDILRVDDQDYTDGRAHTAAISIKNERGELVFNQAEVVRFSGECGLKVITLRP